MIIYCFSSSYNMKEYFKFKKKTIEKGLKLELNENYKYKIKVINN